MAVTGSTSTTGFDQSTFDAFLAARNEPEWIQDQRREAFAHYQRQLAEPLDPEEYKRLDLRTFRPEQYHLSGQQAGVSGQAAGLSTLMRDRAEFAGSVVHQDGHCVQSSLAETLTAKGVLFGDLSTLLARHREQLEPYFLTRAVDPQTDRFSAWHAAFWTGGTVLFVPRGVEIDIPLYSLISLAEDGVADFSHTLVILEDGASATLLEETSSTDPKTAGLHVGAVELIVGQEARLRYVQLQNWNGSVKHIAHQSGRVARDAMLQWTVGALGARMAHIHQDVHLDGVVEQMPRSTGLHSRPIGNCCHTTPSRHITSRTHAQRPAHKEVCRDKSRVIWRGMIKVDPDAQKTDGYQRNDALMLSADARADAIPGLEIEADDVRCTHGATAGRVDDEQLFYAMCRGISEYEAMHMIVEGFFSAVYDRIPVELVRETLSQVVERKLGIGE
ncbi:MAG: SufD family Fe-S cluster assembly protein [Planctomycetaceae bacterium]